MSIYSDATQLKEYINNFNLPKKVLIHTSNESGDCGPAGEGLSSIGEYFFMCFGLIPKNESDKLFDKMSYYINKSQYPDMETYLSLHNIPQNNNEDLLVVISSDPDLIESISPNLKKYPYLKYSDEFNIYPDCLTDNDQNISGMDYQLTLALLSCQDFFIPEPLANFSGESVCFTGFRDKPLEKILIDHGATIVDKVTKKTTLLISKNPDNGSSKEDKANELNIPIFSMFDFITKKLMPNSIKEKP